MAGKVRPLLAIVTGRPGSGKSTLAAELSARIRCPLVSRDRLKEGMLRTTSLHLAGDPDLSLRVFDTFFEQVATLVERQISLVAEAAFQHHVWEPRLKPLIDVVDMRIVVCELPTSLAVERRRARMLEDRRWSQYHPSSEGWESETYDPPRLPVPLLRVDTTEGYVPDLEAIVAFLS